MSSYLSEVIHQPLIKILSAQVRISSSRAHLKQPIAYAEKRHVKRACARQGKQALNDYR